MAELILGEHCDVEHCKQIDFLSFTCDDCKLVFCLEHRTKSAHNCVENVSTADTTNSGSKLPAAKLYACSKSQCKGKELVPVTCEFCGQNFCMSHRHAQDHDCAKLPSSEKPVPMAGTAKLVQQIKERHQAKPAKGAPKSEKARKMAAKVALMKMKTRAEGEKGIPQLEKVYFEVQLPRKSNLNTRPFFFSSSWTIGRIVDWLATKLKLENNNHVKNADKLKLFDPNTRTALPMDAKLKSLLESDVQPLFSGGLVILEYVPDGTDVLEEMEVEES